MKVLTALLVGLVLLATSAAAQSTFNARAVISATGAGDNVVVAGVANKRIFLYGFDLSTTASTTLTIKCGSVAQTGAITLTAYSKPISTMPYFVCGDGLSLVFTTTGANMGGVAWYSQQ